MKPDKEGTRGGTRTRKPQRIHGALVVNQQRGESCHLHHTCAKRGREDLNPDRGLWRAACCQLHHAPRKGRTVSSHYKFEVFVKTPGELDDEDERVERFAMHVRELAAMWSAAHRSAGVDLEISVGGVERN